jgi:hypothetical protein
VDRSTVKVGNGEGPPSCSLSGTRRAMPWCCGGRADWRWGGIIVAGAVGWPCLPGLSRIREVPDVHHHNVRRFDAALLPINGLQIRPQLNKQAVMNAERATELAPRSPCRTTTPSPAAGSATA